MTVSTTPSPLSQTGTVDTAQIAAIVGGYHGAPASILGMHSVQVKGKAALAVRAFRPLEKGVSVLDIQTNQRHPMTQLDPDGFFEVVIAQSKTPFAYRLILDGKDGNQYDIEDPYRFPPLLGELDYHLHGEGNFIESYQKLGAQLRTVDGVSGVNFAVWAPNAQRVSVIGPFNGWDNRVHAMQEAGAGIWEIFIPNLPVGMDYKYAIRSKESAFEADKMDPYGFYSDLRPGTASRVWDPASYSWQDQAWMAQRAERQALDQPMSVYEVHLGSWKRTPETNGFLSYRELAHQLVEHAQKLGFTHIELLPITEHPYDGSWGYQTTGYFAPTSRFGSPDDFKYLVDYCHQNGIGVILDWVPAHFPKDGHGLAFFDGTHLYEHADPRQGEHRDWGTKIFNFGRNEVRNFLLSSALFWLKECHMDGLRVDAVASMLYLDYSREAGEWIPNQYGGRENLDAISFLRRFNELVHAECAGAVTIAEESTSWPMVTRPTYTGGLGFDLKWNMGWMNDILSFFEKDPIHRRYHQNSVTFSLMYAFSENFMLPFSHDEVVHLKKSMLDKMPGDMWRKFANLRLLYAYFFGHPGKKLLFMGGEFGQWREWSEARSLDWHLLTTDLHRQLMAYFGELNRLYQTEPALHGIDFDWQGFQWIDFSDAENSILSFARKTTNPAETIVIVLNLTPIPRQGYRVGLPLAGSWQEILNSDSAIYGGSAVQNQAIIKSEPIPWQSCAHSAILHLPPLGALFLKQLAT